MKSHVAMAAQNGTLCGDGWNAVGDRLKITNDFNTGGWRLTRQRRTGGEKPETLDRMMLCSATGPGRQSWCAARFLSPALAMQTLRQLHRQRDAALPRLGAQRREIRSQCVSTAPGLDRGAAHRPAHCQADRLRLRPRRPTALPQSSRFRRRFRLCLSAPAPRMGTPRLRSRDHRDPRRRHGSHQVGVLLLPGIEAMGTLLARALLLERNALTGRHSRFDAVEFGASWDQLVQSAERFPSSSTTVGLGRNFAWSQWARVNGVVDDAFRVRRDNADRTRFIAQADQLRNADNALDARSAARSVAFRLAHLS